MSSARAGRGWSPPAKGLIRRRWRSGSVITLLPTTQRRHGHGGFGRSTWPARRSTPSAGATRSSSTRTAPLSSSNTRRRRCAAARRFYYAGLPIVLLGPRPPRRLHFLEAPRRGSRWSCPGSRGLFGGRTSEAPGPRRGTARADARRLLGSRTSHRPVLDVRRMMGGAARGLLGRPHFIEAAARWATVATRTARGLVGGHTS